MSGRAARGGKRRSGEAAGDTGHASSADTGGDAAAAAGPGGPVADQLSYATPQPKASSATATAAPGVRAAGAAMRASRSAAASAEKSSLASRKLAVYDEVAVATGSQEATLPPETAAHSSPKRPARAPTADILSRAARAAKDADTFLARHGRPAEAASAAVTRPYARAATAATAQPAPVAMVPLNFEDIPKTDIPRELKLPSHLELIAQFAEQLDVALRHCGKHGVATMKKVKPIVEGQTRRSFTLDHLGQIVAVAPDAYRLRQALIKDDQLGEGSYELVIEARRPGDQQAAGAVDRGKISLSVADMADRNKQFRWRLIYRVATAHGAFLAKQPGQPSVPWATLKRWHSKFDLESVPGVTPAHVPAPPRSAVMTVESLLEQSAGRNLTATAKAAVQHIRDLKAIGPLSGNVHEEEGSDAAAARSVPVPSQLQVENTLEGTAAEGDTRAAAIPKQLQGLLSTEAAARIVARQKQRTEVQLRLDSSDLQRASRLEGLEPVLNMLWSSTKTQNKKSIKKQELIRIVSNKMAVSPTEAEASVRLLAETFATELQEKQIQDQLFLKFETSATLPELKARLLDLANEARQEAARKQSTAAT